MAALALAAGVEGAEGLAGKYVDDKDIENDPAVLFAENFEGADLKKWDEKKGPVALEKNGPNGGIACVKMPMNRGKNDGGHRVKWLISPNPDQSGLGTIFPKRGNLRLIFPPLPGADVVYARWGPQPRRLRILVAAVDLPFYVKFSEDYTYCHH